MESFEMMTIDERARQFVMMMLKDTVPTPEVIREKVGLVSSMLETESPGERVDQESLAREVESLVSIWVPYGTELHDVTGHEPWLLDRKAKIDWDFWKRYEDYLIQEKGWAPEAVIRLEDLTDSVLENLEDPTRNGQWDRRGMVVGHVQSGKTANYTGLICKAVDAGYKLIIVLAGLHNSLRSQTQLRLDEGFLGFDTQRTRAFRNDNPRMGAGRLITPRPLIAHSLTSSAEKGDFNTAMANQIGVRLGSDPVLLVVKKYGSVLDNLIRWALHVSGEQAVDNGRKTVRKIPLLLVDDEADNASINTNPPSRDADGKLLPDEDVTTINRLIRKTLNSFEQSAYVGYTATPFANIFIHPQADSDDFGEDIFPRSFIINLPTPSNYTGPAQVFGLDRDLGEETDASGLPVVRLVNDFEHLIPSKHNKLLDIVRLPESLKTAIRAFIISCAARMARGQSAVHNSMLVHVTRYINPQKRVGALIKDELMSLQRRLMYGDGDASSQLIAELEEMWNDDFVPVTEEIRKRGIDPLVSEVEWHEVKDLLCEAASRIKVKLINGHATDALGYFEHPNGLSVIAVGGDKLSRGLTLEGLTVSYYLRATRMYDTLMQMGRWFGYRPGYVDLCRLYTSRELSDWYKHITAANEELREEFDRMAQCGRTPTDFGLKVRSHPGGLLVTGAGKMRHGTRMQVSFAGSLAESVVFHKDRTVIESNFAETESFLDDMRNRSRSNRRDNFIWAEVPGSEVAGFLGRLTGHQFSRRSDPQKLAEYITGQQSQGELTEWTVALVNNKAAPERIVAAGCDVGLTRRTDDSADDAAKYMLKKAHLISPQDEYLDLTEEEEAEALRLTREQWSQKQDSRREPDRPSGPFIRQVRPSKRGLLLIYLLDPANIDAESAFATRPFVGYAVSFPGSDSARAVEYVVNNVYWDEEFGLQ